jgi:hypothetical protein
MINPYYHPEDLELELLSFDEPSMCYEYNTLCFWATKNGLIYSASDSGCSCPTPFEYYEGETQKDVVQKLERIGSLDQALQIFDSWNKRYDNRPYLSIESRKELENWIVKRIKI